MYTSAKKEQFNRAYMTALASQAGFNSSVPEVDDDSVDFTVIGKGFDGLITDPLINIQLKCTDQDLVVGEKIHFSLKRKNYDDLRSTRLSVPRYLAIMEVPVNSSLWVQHVENYTILASRCFWVSLKGLPDVDQASVTIEVPLEKRLTSESLAHLMHLASNRQDATP